jgi:HAMP domain-containing protein
MSVKYRIPITAITVFGTSGLLAFTVAIVLFLGFGQAVHTTRQLWADQAKTLIDGMEQSLDSRLKPIREQSLWMANDIKDLSEPAALDAYIFGSFAATPHVAGIAVIDREGHSRRWHRAEHVAIDEDWSSRPWIQEYMEMVKDADAPAWRDPIFTDTLDTSTLLHDVPLYNADGDFIGVLAQIVPVEEISALLAVTHADTGVTPFILYNRDYVLAHPQIYSGNFEQPLPHLDELGDLVLQRIWSPDEDADFISSALQGTQASGIFWGDDYYLYLYRNIDRYGPASWTIGAYLNTSLMTDDQAERAVRALTAGLIVLGLAIIASIFIGRKVSSPVKAIVRAAEAVDNGDLDRIESLSGSRIRELDEASGAFNNMVHGLREREVIRDTLGRFVPEEVASSLLAGGGKLDVQQSEATILFCRRRAERLFFTHGGNPRTVRRGRYPVPGRRHPRHLQRPGGRPRTRAQSGAGGAGDADLGRRQRVCRRTHQYSHRHQYRSGRRRRNRRQGPPQLHGARRCGQPGRTPGSDEQGIRNPPADVGDLGFPPGRGRTRSHRRNHRTRPEPIDKNIYAGVAGRRTQPRITR